AWVPAAVIPLLVVLFRGIRRHYLRLAAETMPRPREPLPAVHNTIVIPVGRLHRGTLAAVAYAKALCPESIVAVTVALDGSERADLLAQWREHGIDVPLEVIESPYRDLTGPILDYIDALDSVRPDDVITVIIPEFVLHRWWEQPLHNQTALALKARLLFRPGTVVVSVPYHVD